jgi:putative copper resistance protein D
MAWVDGLSATFRALSFVALFQAAGIAIFLALFGRLLASSAPAIRRVGVFSALFALALLTAQYAMEAGRMSGEMAGVLDASLQALVLHSSTATAFAMRVVGVVLIVASLRADSAVQFVAGLAGVALAIGSFTLVGHTAMHAERWLLGLLLLAHLFIVAFWFGALVPLHIASTRESAPNAAALTESFSRLALRIVPLLLLAGLVLGAVILKSLANLWTTYGQLLLAKLLGFALLMGLAALNKWRLGPALASGGARAGAAFRRSLVAEYLLIAAVLSITAVLTSFYSPE